MFTNTYLMSPPYEHKASTLFIRQTESCVIHFTGDFVAGSKTNKCVYRTDKNSTILNGLFTVFTA